MASERIASLAMPQASSSAINAAGANYPPAAGHFHENACLTLFIAGWVRFFTLTQCGDLPPRYGGRA
jgi:hypothetical protein